MFRIIITYLQFYNINYKKNIFYKCYVYIYVLVGLNTLNYFIIRKTAKQYKYSNPKTLIKF